MKRIKLVLTGLLMGCSLALWNPSANAAQRRRSEAEMCASAEWIFVGTVVRRESFHDPRPDVYISSRVTMKVEAVVHGSPPPFVRFGVMGGVVESERNIVEDQPVAEIGTRYLIFGRLIDVPSGSGIRDRVQLDNRTASSPALKLIRFFTLEPDAMLPSSDELGAVWLEHCLPGSLKGQNARPTQKYLKFMPQSFFDWCEHY